MKRRGVSFPDVNQGPSLVSAHKGFCGHERKAHDFTSIRSPRATSTSSASFMQYTVFTVGSLEERHHVTDGDRWPPGLMRKTRRARESHPQALRAAASLGHQRDFLVLVTGDWQRESRTQQWGCPTLYQLPQGSGNRA